jgi:dipeptidase D
MIFDTIKVLEIFKEISKIPRGSGNEKALSDWLINWSKVNGFTSKQDKYYDISIQIPGTGRFKNHSFSEGYILQGHLDMVCQKTPESTHDFENDPIIPIEKDGWLMTDGQTTLGADNGIAIAMSMYLASLKDFDHMPFELLFTVDEERGLVGALNLSNDFVLGKKLLNIDSEDEGVITIGCAGSRDTTLTKKYNYMSNIPNEMTFLKLTISGGKGGHSGVMIHEKIANSHVLMARFLNRLSNLLEVNLSSWKGGSFRNAIPGETIVNILIDKSSLKQIELEVENFSKIIKDEYGDIEPNLKISSKLIEEKELTYLLQQDTKQIIEAILLVPHGVLGMSFEVNGLVETSNNLAIISIENGILEISTMHRSSVASRLDEVSAKIDAVGKLINAEITHGNSSQPWKPNPEANLLKDVIKKYEKLFNKTPKVEAIHAGLECGAIGAIYEGMEMVSLGPTIKGAHTPLEKLEIESVTKVGELLFEILGN